MNYKMWYGATKLHGAIAMNNMWYGATKLHGAIAMIEVWWSTTKLCYLSLVDRYICRTISRRFYPTHL